jgi:hypothetical protein
MKSKKKQRYPRYLAIIFSLLTSLCLSTFCLIPTASAASESKNNFIADNYNLTEEYSRMLGEDGNYYSSLDEDPQKAVSTSVLGVINLYRKQLLDLQSHPDAPSRLLTSEAKLAFQKGRAAGRLAWIYYSRLPQLKRAESISAVKNEYESHISSINSATDDAVMSAEADVICSQFNNTIFRYLFRELALSDDSLASSSLIAGGLEELERISDCGLFAEKQEALYKRIVGELKLQRAADQLSTHLKTLFAQIRPGEDYQSNSSVALFTYKIKNAKTLQALNDAMSGALIELLEVDESKIYSRLFVGDLCEKISEESLKANKEERAANLLEIFVNYPLESARAAAKDNIHATIFSNGSSEERLKQLETEFNCEGGRVDQIKVEEELALEVTRAIYMKKCHDEMFAAGAEIGIVLKPYEPQSFLDRVDMIYATALNRFRDLGGSVEFEKNCTVEYEKTALELKTVLNEAKAERFLLDHKVIIFKPSSELSLTDEIYARYALDDYIKLEPEVAIALSTQINSIAEKYNSILSQKIRSLLDNDALYLDLCEVFCKEINNISKSNIGDYYNNCDLVLNKAQALCELIYQYRALCADELYSSFNSEEREDLVQICRNTAEKISKIDVNDKAVFADDLAEALKDAQIDLCRINERVRIRVASRNSANSSIKALISEANAKINASYDTNEITSIANKAIFKINRHLTADTITSVGEKLKLNVNSRKFLTSDEKELFISQAEQLCESVASEVSVCENLTVLSFLWSNFSQNLSKIENEIEEKDLTRSRAEHQKLLEEEVDEALSTLREMSHLTSQETEDFSNKLTNLKTSFKSKIAGASSSKEVEKAYEEILSLLHSIDLSANERNLENYKVILKNKLDLLGGNPDDYSAVNYNNILNIITQAKIDLGALGSISSCTALLDSTEKKISLINNLLDDAKNNAISSLEEKVVFYRSKSAMYSSNAMTKIEQIFSSAKREINAFTEISDIPKVEETTSRILRELAAINCDYITNSPSGLGFVAEGSRYPLEHNFIDGYWGLIYSPDALPSDANLSIMPSTSTTLKEIERKIHSATRKGELRTFSGPLSKEELKLIKQCNVILGLDISLSQLPSQAASYNLQLLLPTELKSANILGVAFITKDGNVEFYNAKQRDLLISLDLTHFSEYYILSEKTINLMPLIIFLSILITLEFIVLIFVLIIRFNRKRKENDDMLPMLSSCFVPTFSTFVLTKIQPAGAVSAAILLSVAALALGCGIAILARLEIRESKASKSHRGAERSSLRETQKLLSGSSTASLPAYRYQLEAAKKQISSNSEDAYYESSAPVCTIDAKDTDEDLERIFEDDDGEAYTCFGKAHHRAEINLDVIAEAFCDGDLVTLESLKRKRLVPKKTDYVKVLARGTLSKPLIIEANDFSRAAEEMLIALGGEAIRVRH